jgi:hypothetical protein
LSSTRLAAPRRDIAGNRDPWVVLRGCEGPRPDAKVASDPVAPSRFLRLGTDLPHGRFPHDFHGSVIYPQGIHTMSVWRTTRSFGRGIPATSRMDLMIAVLSWLAVFALISALIAGAFR